MSSKLSKSINKLIKSLIYIKANNEIDAEKILKEELNSNNPSMIARFGSTEIKAVIFPKSKWVFRFLLKRMMNYDSDSKEFLNMKILSGFFPSTEENIYKFSNLIFQDMKQLDVLGSWRFEERFLFSNFKFASIVPLQSLEPYFQENPWSQVLENKKILVIHPFNKTIESQYKNKRELLFKDIRVLPKFKSLQTIKAVQSLAGNKVIYDNWFNALDFMKNQIVKTDFDIAIIGAGAYGFSLAAFIKKIGKKAVHLGGPTQVLFGIKGKRWIENPKFNKIINKHFVFPCKDDRIQNANQVEEACYW